MNLILTIASLAGSIFVVLWLIRVFLLGQHVAIQLDKVDKPVGRVQYLKLFVFYLRNPDRLQKSIDL